MRQVTGIGLLVLVVLSGVAALGWWTYDRARGDALPEGIIAANGRVEARLTRVASTGGGRVIRIDVEEGDPVHSGEVLVEMDRRTVEAAQASAEAAHAAALENIVATERRIDARQSQLDLARTETERLRRLHAGDAVSRQSVERAEAGLVQLEQEVRAARAGLDLARRQADAARAQMQGVSVGLSETVVLAPVSGVVQAVLVRPGEVAAPGAPLLRLAESAEVRVRVYLPIAEAGRVRPGMEARVYADGLGDRSLPGSVERVAEEAEFTPRDVHMPDDRTTLVIAVTLRFPNPDRSLRDGFPADVFIRWDPASPWPEQPPWR